MPLLVSFDDSIAKGAFGAILLGTTRHIIGEQLGAPTDTSLPGRKRSTQIWKYGNSEFYFEDDVLMMIHCYGNDLFDGGSTLQVTSASFQTGMPVQQAKTILDSLRIRYTDVSSSNSPEYDIRLTTGYQLGFVVDADAGLGSIGLRSWTLRRSG